MLELIGSGIGNVENQDIRGADLAQFVHNRRNRLLLYHSADGNPSISI